jgi:hypothetical protein
LLFAFAVVLNLFLFIAFAVVSAFAVVFVVARFTSSSLYGLFTRHAAVIHEKSIGVIPTSVSLLSEDVLRLAKIAVEEPVPTLLPLTP